VRILKLFQASIGIEDVQERDVEQNARREWVNQEAPTTLGEEEEDGVAAADSAIASPNI
jgi:hypothetical protein